MSENPTLYDIEVGLLEAIEKIEALQQQPDVSKEDVTIAFDVLEIYIKESAIKRESVCRFLAHLDYLTGNVDAEIERLKKKRDSLTKAKERLSVFVLSVMARIGQKNLEANTFTLKAHKNPARVEITDPIAIPADYLRIPDPLPPVIDKKKISDDLKAGKEVAGAKLIHTDRLVIE